MSASKLVWYHVATHKWRDVPPKDGTWAMPHVQGRSPFSGLPHHTAIIDKLEQERAKLERENAALREAFAKAELLSDPAVAEGHYEYVEVWGYFRPNEIAVVIDRAAFDAARKEAKP